METANPQVANAKWQMKIMTFASGRNHTTKSDINKYRIFTRVIDTKHGRFLRRAGPSEVFVVSKKIRSKILKLDVIQAVAIPQEMIQTRTWKSEVSPLEAYGSQNKIRDRRKPVIAKEAFITAK